ncbi:hypothetical protein QQZ08_008451 [Neonectria magnoliae]|uniref:LYR motif-containing protein Cup1-like N-terminal domain-containing protein n=1 Tax=Neonectria magnoliae TaxID=2732573 RepID=A0ABR1HV41_9HYPO
MPRPNTPIPGFLAPLHVYRHLLRECSYLPPAWRSPIISILRDRYHRHSKNDDRQNKHRARAYQLLNTLRSANDGHRESMQKFMRMGFARSGIRRRRLMQSFVLQNGGGPNDSEALEALLGANDSKAKAKSQAADTIKNQSEAPSVASLSKNAFHLNWDQPKLIALLESQKKMGKEFPLIQLTSAVKNLKETQYVPETNIWGKPPCESLVITKKAHWWRRAAAKMLVPLKKDEWELLGRLSAGAQEVDEEWMVPERRKPAKLLRKEPPPASDWDWESHADHCVKHAEREKTVKRVRRTGQKDTGPYQGQMVQREITPRWYRRAYTRLWQVTPVMEQDPRSLKHSFTWGNPNSGLRPARASQLNVFEGVDDKGVKLPDPPSNSS